MEGLPVRQWQKRPAVVNTAPPKENTYTPSDRNSIWNELPMPKGSELYSDLSRRLLRAARAPRIPGQPAKVTEDDKEPGEEEDAEGEADTGFTAMRWSQVPRKSEQPEPEFLAKRRKGLPSIYGVTASSGTRVGLMRKTKVKRVDNEGNTVFLDVLVPEGTVVEGEIAEADEIATEAPAPGTVVEGVGIANAEGVIVAGEALPTPPRRRPPPPKRKPKGPGRGRKKKVVAENGSSGTPGALNVNGLGAETTESTTGGLKVPGIAADGAASTDVEMGDDSVLQDGEEGSEEDDEEGEDGEDGDREEGELSEPEDSISRSASPIKPKPATTEVPTLTFPSVEVPSTIETANRDPSSSPDLPLAAAQAQQNPTITIEQVLDTIPATATVALPSSAINSQDATLVESADFNHERMQAVVTAAEPFIPQQLVVGPGAETVTFDVAESTPLTRAMETLSNNDDSADNNLPLVNVPRLAPLGDVGDDEAITSVKSQATTDSQTYIEPTIQPTLESGSSQPPVVDSIISSAPAPSEDVHSPSIPSALFVASGPVPYSLSNDSIEPLSEGDKRIFPEVGEPISTLTGDRVHSEPPRTEPDEVGKPSDGEDDLLGSLEKHLDSKSTQKIVPKQAIL